MPGPNTPPIPPRRPVLPPVPGKTGPKPPPPPAAAVMRPIVGASQIPLTVDSLANSFTMDILREVVNYQQKERGCAGVYSRPARTDNVAGGLIVNNGSRDMYVFGDEHGNVPRLEVILDIIGPLLRDPKANIEVVFLGDLLHREKTDIADMGSSFKVLKAVVMLQRLFPERVHLLLGNHDSACSNRTIFDVVYDYPHNDHSQWGHYLNEAINQGKMQMNDFDFRMRVGKRDVPQALEFARYLCAQYKAPGKSRDDVWRDVESFQQFFDSIPVAMIIEDKKLGGDPVFLAHSLTRADQFQLRDIRLPQNSDILKELITNKASEGSISEQDIPAIFQGLGLLGNPIAITGHEYPSVGYGYRVFPNGNLYILHGNGPDFGYCRISGRVPRMMKADDTMVAIRLAQDAA